LIQKSIFLKWKFQGLLIQYFAEEIISNISIARNMKYPSHLNVYREKLDFHLFRLVFNVLFY